MGGFFFERIRLATHLYAESLLDRIGFLDWLVSFLESCSLDHLPLAIVLAATFWDDLLKLRRFARRLTEALMAKYEAVRDLCALDQSYAPLICRLSVMASVSPSEPPRSLLSVPLQ